MARIKHVASRTGFVNRLPSCSLLKELFRYDDKNGYLYWKKRTNYSVKMGVPIGSKQYAKGKRAVVRINGTLYYVSRVMWKMKTGKDPGSKEVDHDDRDMSNDKWGNLKLLTRKQNLDKRDKKLIAANSRRQLLTQPFGRSTWTKESYSKWRKSMGYAP